MTDPVRVALSAAPTNPSDVAEVAEQFARTAAALALRGIDTFVALTPDTDD